eukprot:356636-Rhodomonas_salina.2
MSVPDTPRPRPPAQPPQRPWSPHTHTPAQSRPDQALAPRRRPRTRVPCVGVLDVVLPGRARAHGRDRVDHSLEPGQACSVLLVLHQLRPELPILDPVLLGAALHPPAHALAQQQEDDAHHEHDAPEEWQRVDFVEEQARDDDLDHAAVRPDAHHCEQEEAAGELDHQRDEEVADGQEHPPDRRRVDRVPLHGAGRARPDAQAAQHHPRELEHAERYLLAPRHGHEHGCQDPEAQRHVGNVPPQDPLCARPQVHGHKLLPLLRSGKALLLAHRHPPVPPVPEPLRPDLDPPSLLLILVVLMRMLVLSAARLVPVVVQLSAEGLRVEAVDEEKHRVPLRLALGRHKVEPVHAHLLLKARHDRVWLPGERAVLAHWTPVPQQPKLGHVRRRQPVPAAVVQRDKAEPRALEPPDARPLLAGRDRDAVGLERDKAQEHELEPPLVELADQRARGHEDARLAVLAVLRAA